jgi:protein-tyrosine phosphatase
VIDLHCHLLPDIDDGPADIEGSIAIARAAAATGTRVMVATPHVSWRYPNDAAAIGRRVAELDERLAAEGIALELFAGAEIAFTRLLDIDPAELSRLSLGGSGWLLIEPPFTALATGLDTAVLELKARGHRVLLAHPERCPALHRDPRMLAALLHAGALTSITAGSLTGRFGAPVQRFALQLARERMVHNIASDAHDAVQRPPGVAAEIARSGLGPLAEWLTERVPAAILHGDETIPPRPAVALPGIDAPGRRWWRRRRRFTQAW